MLGKPSMKSSGSVEASGGSAGVVVRMRMWRLTMPPSSSVMLYDRVPLCSRMTPGSQVEPAAKVTGKDHITYMEGSTLGVQVMSLLLFPLAVGNSLRYIREELIQPRAKSFPHQ